MKGMRAGNDAFIPDMETPLTEEERAKIIARQTWRHMLALIDETLKQTPLNPMDLLLVLVIGAANLSHIDNNPELSRRHAAGVEPNEVRHGISRGAIARALSMPAETVRRRLNALIDAKVLVERDDGIILAADNPLAIGARSDLWLFHARQFERLLRDLKLRGVDFP